MRNPQAEEDALMILSDTGFSGDRGDQLDNIIGTREVMNFLGGELPKLRRLGWKVNLEGRVEPFMDDAEFAMPVVKIRDGSSPGVFEVGFEFEDGQGQSLSPGDIQRAV